MATPRNKSPDMVQAETQGFTAVQLAHHFRLAASTVRQRLAHIKPSSHEAKTGTPLWSIFTVSPHLTPPPADMVERVIRLNHMGLPPGLSKEYWQGQHEQIRVKALEGAIWNTEDIVSYVGDMLQEIRMEVLLMDDAIRRSFELTDPQRTALQGLVDGCVTGIRNRLREFFTEKIGERVGKSAAESLRPPEEDPAADL
jgi:hypothetical protein